MVPSKNAGLFLLLLAIIKNNKAYYLQRSIIMLKSQIRISFFRKEVM